MVARKPQSAALSHPPPRLTSLEQLGQAAECLRTLAHPHRLRIVQMLLGGRYTVGELADACGIPSHMASEHLRLMQRCGFLRAEKEGRRAYYAVTEPHLASILACIEARFGAAATAGRGRPARAAARPPRVASARGSRS